MKKILAFDIDGTLVDVKTNVQPGVKNLFLDKRVNNTQILFITGNTITTINRVRNNLLKLNPNLNCINSYSATLGGAIVYNGKNEIVRERFLCRKKLRRILDVVVENDPESFFLYMHKNVQTFNHIVSKEIENMIIENYDKINLDSTEFRFNYENYQEVLPKLPRIYSINIFSKNNEETYKQLLPLIKEFGYFMYYSKRFNLLQISACSKLSALRFISKKLSEENQSSCKVSNMVYFGDGGNDIQCLKACNFSIARGENLQEEVVKSAKVYAEDITPFLDKIFE